MIGKLVKNNVKYFPIEHEGNVYWVEHVLCGDDYGKEWWFNGEWELRFGYPIYREENFHVVAQNKPVLEDVPTINVEDLSQYIYVNDYWKPFSSKYDAQKSFVTKQLEQNKLSIESTEKVLKRLYEERSVLQNSVINIGDRFEDSLERIMTVISLYIPPLFVDEIEFLLRYDYNGVETFEVMFDKDILKMKK